MVLSNRFGKYINKYILKSMYFPRRGIDDLKHA